LVITLIYQILPNVVQLSQIDFGAMVDKMD
jgi:hypothetical protein